MWNTTIPPAEFIGIWFLFVSYETVQKATILQKSQEFCKMYTNVPAQIIQNVHTIILIKNSFINLNQIFDSELILIIRG